MLIGGIFAKVTFDGLVYFTYPTWIIYVQKMIWLPELNSVEWFRSLWHARADTHNTTATAAPPPPPPRTVRLMLSCNKALRVGAFNIFYIKCSHVGVVSSNYFLFYKFAFYSSRKQIVKDILLAFSLYVCVFG